MVSRSPLDVPFFKEEPFLGLDAKNVKVLIQAAYDEYLFIVSDWLSTEKLLRLLQATLIHSQNDVGLSVEVEAVAYPSIITTKYQDFRVVKSE